MPQRIDADQRRRVDSLGGSLDRAQAGFRAPGHSHVHDRVRRLLRVRVIDERPRRLGQRDELRVGGHAHDLGVRFVAGADELSQRIDVREVASGEGLVDDDDGRRTDAIRPAKLPAANPRNPHRLEIARADDVHERRRASAGPAPANVEAPLHDVARERHHVGDADRPDVGQRLEPLGELLGEAKSALRRPAAVERDPRDDAGADIEAGIERGGASGGRRNRAESTRSNAESATCPITKAWRSRSRSVTLVIAESLSSPETLTRVPRRAGTRPHVRVVTSANSTA